MHIIGMGIKWHNVREYEQEIHIRAAEEQDFSIGWLYVKYNKPILNLYTHTHIIVCVLHISKELQSTETLKKLHNYLFESKDV